ncbi:GNAT family N-acetyltransferase [Burkholderia vietnamiensis]|uniref:GNAT family N-acetyltransferase n=1 Tax=Burkholderia vietnamiensis TaxID=60552 RepID=UPI002012AFE9|nr:GNAT family N-acetyltransferase [Burkholderia vietnamiensis]
MRKPALCGLFHLRFLLVPACGHVTAERRKPPARLPAGREGLRVHAQPRPAGCRRVPSAPPENEKARLVRAFSFALSSRARMRGRLDPHRRSEKFAIASAGDCAIVAECDLDPSAMLDPTDLRLLYQLRPAESGDFPFAEALTHGNMGAYYKRHGLVWRSDLFYASWRESENFILEADGERIGVLRVTEEGDSLHIRDVQIAAGHRGQGAGTYMLDMSHRWARARGLHELQLRVFVDNPAARLYQRMGYRVTGPRPAQLGSIRHMVRAV